MLNTEHAKRYARHALAKRKLEQKAKEIGQKLETWSQPLIDHMIDEEIEKLNLKGGITLNLHPQIWAKMLAKDEDGNTDNGYQWACFYDGERVLGGGVIERALESDNV